MPVAGAHTVDGVADVGIGVFDTLDVKWNAFVYACRYAITSYTKFQTGPILLGQVIGGYRVNDHHSILIDELTKIVYIITV